MTICEHIKDNGSTCGSPALTGYSFCFFHQRLRHPRHRPGDFEYKLPILDTPESILMATQHITQAALDGILEDRRARLVLSALRLAKATLKEMQKHDEMKKNGLQRKGKEEEKLSDEIKLLGEVNLSDAARPRAAFATAEDEHSASPTNRLDNVDTGFQARVGVAPATPPSTESSVGRDAAAAAPEGSPRREPWVSITSTTKAPAGATDKPLSAHQSKLLKKILRRGPKHPQFKLAARLLDHDIAGAK